MEKDMTFQKDGSRGIPFQKGESGNPAGRPRGTRNKVTILMACLKKGDLEEIMAKVIKAAKDGDLVAARLVVDVIFRSRRYEPVVCELPSIKTPDDVVVAMQKIADEVASGELTAEAAGDITRVFDLFLQAFAHVRLDQRIKHVEGLAGTARSLASVPKLALDS
jgi:hypothetical protein